MSKIGVVRLVYVLFCAMYIATIIGRHTISEVTLLVAFWMGFVGNSVLRELITGEI